MSNLIEILFLNSSDTQGGAARAAYRLFDGLRSQGLSVKMLVREKTSNDSDVISCIDFERKGLLGKLDKFVWRIKNLLQKQKWKKYPNREKVFLNDLNSISLLRAINSIDYDVIHLHFVANRFLDLRELTKLNKPIVLTLHDCWAFTGICHFFYDCKRYEESCGCCPMLHSNNPNDYTHNIWKIKNKVYKQCNMHIVSPSHWLGNCASNSSLLRNVPVSVIPNGIDLQFYRRLPQNEARAKLGLDIKKDYVMFGAVNAISDRNKGFHLLVEALKFLPKQIGKTIEFLVFGATKPAEAFDFGFPIHYMGVINNEETLVQLYNAADVIVVPSMSENLSNTIMESIACGTRVVGFDIGGNADMIVHKQNGYLAKPFDCNDMAIGIDWCLENKDKINFQKASRKMLANFGLEKVTEKYLNIYQKMYNAK